jgi:ATP-dependent Clp protease adaptor protein ClpS
MDRDVVAQMNADARQSPDQTPSQPPAQAPATAVMDAPAKTPRRTTPQQLPPFRVLLHNDDVNEMLFVVGTVMELASLPKERAILVALEADTTGVALVLVTHKERAELYMDQFTSKGLTVTIEPAE